jgi:Neuraminidase (sialidase)
VVGPLLGALADKPWLELDTNPASPFANSLYVSVTQFAGNNDSQISVSHSRDGGKTWVSKLVGTRERFPNVAQFSDLAVGADGTVYVTWQRCRANGPASDCGGTTARMVISKSTDGGDTWSTPILITTANLVPDTCFCAFYGSLPNTSERVANIPAIAVDNSTRPTAGNLYVVFYHWTGTQMQVRVTTSSDGGTTWGTPVNVSTSTSGDQFFPWINLASNGRIAVTWLDRRNDAANLRYQPFFAISTNAGTSFGTNRALSNTASNPNNDGFGGTFMGDYRGHVWVGKAFYASWMDMRTGVCQDVIGGVQF